MIIKEERIGGQRLILGDCLERMKEIPDGSVDLTVTSPPYDNLRTYNGTLNDWTPEKWQAIIRELFRVTKQGGVVVWVVGDATIKGSETGTSFRQALWAIECGFRLHDTMIYEKQNPVPYHHNRYQPCFEYMFVWSKGKPSTFKPIMVASSGIVGGSRQRSADGTNKAFNSGGAAHPQKYRPCIWRYSVGNDRSGHPAVFPQCLARDHILSWSNPGDTVFDPFLGSGTTGKMALLECRRFIGIERDETYFQIAIDRIATCKRVQKAVDQPDMFIAPPAPQPTQEGFDV
jgi:DNA modification methylase